MPKAKKKIWEYPIRVCRGVNECKVCGTGIMPGEEYYDGGYGRRAHWNCAHSQKKVPCAQDADGEEAALWEMPNSASSERKI